MAHSFNQAALTIILNSMKGKINPRLAYIEQKMDSLELAVNVTLTYTSDLFDIIPEVENAVVDMLAKANPVLPNVQVHIALSPVMVKADKAITEFIFTIILSQLFYSIQQGALLTVHITKTEEAGIIEIQETGHIQTICPAFDYAEINTDQQLVVCRQLMEDMGGEMVYLYKDNRKYFRLKFLLG